VLIHIYQALLKIAKHCHESLPQMVTGSLLGLANGATLEITYAFPLSEAPDDDDATEDYRSEMMNMLQETNVDNNCVGWYQSMYLGSYSTMSFLENQYSYQTEMSPDAVVLLYDPLQTSNGSLCLKCYRLTEAYIQTKAVVTGQIFEAVPIRLHNPGLCRAMVAELQTDTTMDCLDLSTNPYLEKHLEFLCSWVDDLAQEQQKFQYWARANNTKRRNKSDPVSAAAAGGEAPKKLESLLIANQIRTYCDQMDKFAGGGFGKLYLVSGLHKDDRTGA
jgi:translation initiation factor 3 subunit H